MTAALLTVTPSRGPERWEWPPADLQLPADTVHVWRVRLDLPPDVVGELAATLSPDEQRRAVAFRSETDRRRFVARRGLLRHTLARYLDVPPVALTFLTEPGGKPELAGEPLRFSCTHSQGLALFACTKRRRVGIDIEAIRPVPDLAEIVRRHFSADEQALFDGLAPAARLAQFFRGWTGKEAWVKATGDGLAARLADLPVLRSGTGPGEWTSPERSSAAGPRILVLELVVAAGYSAAVAVEE